MTTSTPIRYVVIDGTVCDVNATGFDDSVVPLYVSAKHYDALKSDLAAAQEALANLRKEYANSIEAWTGINEEKERAEARAESYLEILREVDGLIKYQYSGSREAMSYLQHIANRVFAAIDAAREGK